MLTENDVIDAVCAELFRHGWMIKTTAITRQRGDDIVAEKDGTTLIVEVKGATSSKSGSARHGVEFNGARCTRTWLLPSSVLSASHPSG